MWHFLNFKKHLNYNSAEMRISRFEERGSLGIVSDTLGNKIDSGVCVSVGDAIDVFEENILR
jgi:hypothetical protein